MSSVIYYEGKVELKGQSSPPFTDSHVCAELYNGTGMALLGIISGLWLHWD